MIPSRKHSDLFDLEVCTLLPVSLGPTGDCSCERDGVYWYLFSNHCSRRCIYETVIMDESENHALALMYVRHGQTVREEGVDE